MDKRRRQQRQQQRLLCVCREKGKKAVKIPKAAEGAERKVFFGFLVFFPPYQTKTKPHFVSTSHKKDTADLLQLAGFSVFMTRHAFVDSNHLQWCLTGVMHVLMPHYELLYISSRGTSQHQGTTQNVHCDSVDGVELERCTMIPAGVQPNQAFQAK